MQIARMRSDGAFTKRKGAGFSLLSEEVPRQTLANTTYVRLMHPKDDVDALEDRFELHDVMGKHGPGTRWSWLKRPGREVKEIGLAKSKSYNAWAWMGRPPPDEYQFDPTKRWPQGW